MTPVQFNKAANSYVDHELSVNLDSTEAFEGPEKLLEIWFHPNADNAAEQGSLRSIPFDEWSKILDLVNCKVLSIKKSSQLDAFLLSESSLFVYDHKLILKTCGTTTTLHCLDALFHLVNKTLGWNFLVGDEHHQPFKVFYSRRAFMFPLKQKSIHKNWSDEVAYLNQFFTNGSHYLIGRIGNSHWHLYTTSLEKPGEPYVDETFEILMTELSQDKCVQFNTLRKPGFQIDDNDDLGHFLGTSTSKNIGLIDLYNSVGLHDAFQFTPCGYSSNTIMNDDTYYTVHVTPEQEWSYASFESNVIPQQYGLDNLVILERVLGMFNPNKFQLTFFTNSLHGDNFIKLMSLTLKDYKKVDKIVYDLGNYQLLYISFQKTEESIIDGLTLN